MLWERILLSLVKRSKPFNSPPLYLQSALLPQAQALRAVAIRLPI